MDTKWVVADVPSAAQIDRMAQETGATRLVSAILCVRGFDTASAKAMLSEQSETIHDPFLMKDMHAAVERIFAAIRSKEKITVFGDYDADGVTSCALLVQCLKQLGTDADYYIPRRESEGYGMSMGAVDTIAATGTKLIITVDCGITAVEECAYAKNCGIDVIVTDHHECGEKLPDAVAVIDAKQADCQYPCKQLAGVGVALKLAQALLQGQASYVQTLEQFAELAAIGTIADIVPLVDENREICKRGLQKISHTGNCGIRALLEVSGIQNKPIDTSNIGFLLAPKINAAGRLENAASAIDLFLTEDYECALDIAHRLHTFNIQRQEIEMQILREAEALLEEKYQNDRVLVLANASWHHGVVGIVASRLTKKYHKPCILITAGTDGHDKGSGRSIEGFSLYAALAACKDTLIGFGGHELAAGLVMEREQIDAFRKRINQYAEKFLSPELMVPVLKADCELRGRHLNLKTAESLEILKPYGMGNKQPLFYISDLLVQQVQRIGTSGQHLKLKLNKNGVMIDAVAFGFGENNGISYGSKISVMCHLEINAFRNIKEAQLRITDIK